MHIRLRCYKLVTWGKYQDGAKFNNTVALMVYLNVVTMCMYVWTAPSPGDLPHHNDWKPNPVLYQTLDIMQYVFTFLFILEATIRVTALGRKQYWASVWNRFDVVVGFLTFLAFISDVTVGGLNDLVPPTFFRVIRALRVFPFGKAIRR